MSTTVLASTVIAVNSSGRSLRLDEMHSPMNEGSRRLLGRNPVWGIGKIHTWRIRSGEQASSRRLASSPSLNRNFSVTGRGSDWRFARRDVFFQVYGFQSNALTPVSES